MSINLQSFKQISNRDCIEQLVGNQIFKLAPLAFIKCWLNNIDVKNNQLAHAICRFIPTQCPFERKISFWGKTILSIPPLCKLNPFYEEVVALRFRAICYLADECGEDVSAYC